MADQNLCAKSAGLKMLTAGRLRELIHYNPETGKMIWREDRGRMRCKGREAGAPDNAGYLLVKVDYRLYKAHRLAWLYMTGEWPLHQIDHANGKTADNRWLNLRAATSQQNAFNTARKVRNRTGYKGVTFLPENGRFRANIWLNRRGVALGVFPTAEEAHAAYVAAAQRHHGEFLHLPYAPPFGGG